MANIGYVRVSSKDQNTGRQFAVMEERGIKLDRTYEEHVSGKNISDRPQLLAMLDYIREGDIVYIESISRLARNTVDFLDIANRLKEKGVGLISLKESIDTSTPQGRFVTTLFAAFAELERDFIRERQREGIDLCLREGRPYGRPRRSFDDIWKEIIDNGVLVRLHQKSLCFVSIYLLPGFMLVCIDMKKFLENVDCYHYKKFE